MGVLSTENSGLPDSQSVGVHWLSAVLLATVQPATAFAVLYVPVGVNSKSKLVAWAESLSAKDKIKSVIVHSRGFMRIFIRLNVNFETKHRNSFTQLKCSFSK